MDTAPAAPPPGDPVEHPAQGPTPRVPLRVTLVALMVALVAAALAATGFAATSLLRDYLVEQQDEQLDAGLDQLAGQPVRILQACAGDWPRIPSNQYIACLGLDAEEDSVSVVQGPDDDDLPDVSRLDATEVGVDGTDAISTASQDGRTTWRVGAIRVPSTPVSEEYVVVLGLDLSADEDALGRLVRIELIVGLLVLAVLGVAGHLVVRNSLRPLTEVEDTARAIAAGDLSRRVPVGDDRTEVGRLSAALNGMLGRIESSFRAQQASEEHAVASEARMRRFVADASHELRTPLTSIRGFAELHRQGAVDGPEDTGRLMQRIESEATRMGLLVEDLLQLARLDQQRPLALAPVDLAELAGDAVHDARAVAPDRPVSLQLDPSLTDVPVVRGDEARLRQVIGNLVANALTHTPAGTRVTLRVAEDETEPDGLVVAVSDEGPGLAPADADRVFERFYRADSSRTRAAGGTGLGLSIVAALVEAHGGRVELHTAPGEGATFAVHLPRSGPQPSGPT
ncbi:MULTISPECIES: sensor histidine kinase [unclassified Modestobacter]|uniref:sensor histidine kinase n=1 Tax=unclassified Modestobacter TaxID=2643866 RepID=UPI0022AA62DB|nr:MULTISPECIES: HAMP domain-containing sensor histidine kinase [unclassified Modestobacter]MCZ2823482.1 HAMP domain-containing sensor histidine kinase [Modestobacter sp. VKM Ac-2981]MCZ2851727.1 HAMP domain-containing sensor histidine kinase [Modestobacter sp. VKM Ac-2982]